MMNKKKTNAIWSSKYLLTVPVLLTAILLINATELKSAWADKDLPYFTQQQSVIDIVKVSGKVADANDGKSLSGVPVTVKEKPSNHQSNDTTVINVPTSMTTSGKYVTCDSSKHSFSTDIQEVGSQSLIFVDGKEINDGLNKIHPNDIESITILKDENATNVYGEKGKNGVVLITLKKQENSNDQVLNTIPIIIPSGFDTTHCLYILDGKVAELKVGESYTSCGEFKKEKIASAALSEAPASPKRSITSLYPDCID